MDKAEAIEIRRKAEEYDNWAKGRTLFGRPPNTDREKAEAIDNIMGRKIGPWKA